ncbi:hypothetical protein PUN28_009229 [Cardiocondyla obscurior]|uniref:Uncharacterized protein n=1 Tax=Cardiocondyla obscurior TaxID=286306 RepID=A0AAW2FWV7_9HYME
MPTCVRVNLHRVTSPDRERLSIFRRGYSPFFTAESTCNIIAWSLQAGGYYNNQRVRVGLRILINAVHFFLIILNKETRLKYKLQCEMYF